MQYFPPPRQIVHEMSTPKTVEQNNLGASHWRRGKIQVQFPAGLLKQIESWAHFEQVTRSDAIRQLIEAGLDAKPSWKRDKG
jgi:hypothetical protein